MSFQPLVPIGGIAGFRFVEKTLASQQEVFNKSPLMAREVQHFKDNVWKHDTAEKLADDYITFKVALGAFGLEDEVSKKFFIKKILEEGTEDRGALANRLVDPRYRALSEEFGYGNLLGTNVTQSDFASRLVDQYQIRQFEKAVGNSDNSIRLAMNFKREIAQFTGDFPTEDTPWFQIMGNTPLRTVFETAFGLPTAIGTLDVDKQLEMFKDKANSILGTDALKVFSDPEKVDEIIERFLARAQLDQGPTNSTRGFAALSLLQNNGFGASSTANLLLSQG